MPSPFPGMNPFLEREFNGSGFRTHLLMCVRAQLVPQIRSNYIVSLDRRVGARVMSEEEVTTARVMFAGLTAGPSLEPLTVVEEREPYLRILDRETREVVTVIELLSPINKRPGSDRDAFLAKRDRVLASRAGYVEIDLLRGGPPMPMNEEPPGGTYRVVVSRGGDGPAAFGPSRPPADVWLWELRDPLPNVPVPLKPPHPDAVIDLRAALDRTYDEAGFEDYLHLAPPDPPLDDADADWAAELLAEAGPAPPA